MITVKINKTKNNQYMAYSDDIGVAYGETIEEVKVGFMRLMRNQEIVKFEVEKP